MVEALRPERLRTSCDFSRFGFVTTADLDGEAGVPGQGRAEDAIRFAIGMGSEGFNVYAMGPAGLGKHEIVRRILDESARTKETPSDWCYVHDLESGQKPRALRFPAGRATVFARAMDHFVEELRGAIPIVFETDEFRARRHDLDVEFQERQDKAFDELRGRARTRGLDLVRMETGMALAPFRDGEVMDPAVYAKLPEEEQKQIAGTMSELQGDLEKVIHDIPRLRREAGKKVRELNRMMIRTAVHDRFLDVRKVVEDLPDVLTFLDAVGEDVLEHAEGLLERKEGDPATANDIETALRRYRINVLVDNAATKGAPVVHLDHATFPNLIGRIEHLSQMGNLITDFTLIRPGALQKANGGYLLLDALDVLSQPLSWGALKRALRARSVRVELPGQSVGFVTAAFLEPEPIPLDVKVVLHGERSLFYQLQQGDPEFPGLFKVAADFEEDVARDDEGVHAFVRLVAAISRKERLLPLQREAVGRLVEHASRKAEDGGKLSLRLRDLADLLREADFFSKKEGSASTSAADIERALEARERRVDRLRTRVLDETVKGTLLIDTAGAKVGQVNALSVLRLGEATFGHPTRVTARTRLGSGKLVDILREVEMGGPNHTKGVLILGGFLAGRFLPDLPLSLSASLVLEQSYGGVDGDSASSAELYALLSALAEVPIRQSFAVTGSVNQLGEVQAIGGVNEKIEGFFDLCARRGLTGEQGVLIPKSNLPNLMLRKDVVAAAEAGRFHVFLVETIDEGIELLTGLAAGERGADGRFPDASVNGRVEARLLAFAKAARASARPGENAQEET